MDQRCAQNNGVGKVLSVEDQDIVSARELADAHPDLTARDLLHLAVMKQHGITEIITADRKFDGVPGIRRIDLTDAAPRP